MEDCSEFIDKLPMKRQAVRIVSTRQEEFSWQSTTTWEQLWERKKVESIPGPKELPMGECQRRIAYLLGVLLALRRMDSEE